MQQRAEFPSLMRREGLKERAEEVEAEVPFTVIYESYYERIFRYIRFRVASSHTAEDLTSLVFEKTWRKRGTYSRNKAPFEVWLFAIARNVVNDHYRSRARKRWFALETVCGLVSSMKDPERLVIQEEANDRLAGALEKLSTKERNIIALKFGAALRNTEIAGIAGISESNVGVILYRARFSHRVAAIFAGGLRLRPGSIL